MKLEWKRSKTRHILGNILGFVGSILLITVILGVGSLPIWGMLYDLNWRELYPEEYRRLEGDTHPEVLQTIKECMDDDGYISIYEYRVIRDVRDKCNTLSTKEKLRAKSNR